MTQAHETHQPKGVGPYKPDTQVTFRDQVYVIREVNTVQNRSGADVWLLISQSEHDDPLRVFCEQVAIVPS